MFGRKLQLIILLLSIIVLGTIPVSAVDVVVSGGSNYTTTLTGDTNTTTATTQSTRPGGETIYSSDPGYGYDADKSAPTGLFKEHTEGVEPGSGALKLNETDLVLPGKNGFDLKISRFYNSHKAESDKISATQKYYPPYSMVPSDTEVTATCPYDSSHTATLFISAGTPVDTNTVDFYFDAHFHDGIYHEETTVTETIPGVVDYGEEYEVTNIKDGGNFLDSVYHLGLGWGFDFPLLESPTKSGSTQQYLHLGDSEYKVNFSKPSGLEGPVTKDYILYKYSSVDFPDLAYKLWHKSGVAYYLNKSGKIARMRDRYGNIITFTWETVNNQERLKQIQDSVNRIITFQYDTDRVTLTVLPAVSSDTPYVITYYKETTPSGQYKLSTVEYPVAGTQKAQIRYTYDWQVSDFAFWKILDPSAVKGTHYYLGLKSRENQYGGKTQYTYRSFSRVLDSDGGYENYYKVQSSNDLVTTNGVQSVQNYTAYSYANHDSSTPEYTTTIAYQGLSSNSVARQEVYTFNRSKHQNTKIVTTLGDNTSYVNSQTMVYEKDLPKVIVSETTNAGKVVTTSVSTDYNDYGTLVRKSTSTGNVAESNYSILSLPSMDVEVLNTTRTLVNPIDSGKIEYIGEQYTYDAYANVIKKENQQLDGSYTTPTRKIGSSSGLITNQKYEIVLPEKSSLLNLSIYYCADNWGGDANYSIRLWEVGKDRSTASVYNYTHYSNWLNEDKGYDSIPNFTLDKTKRYQLEVLATKVNGSNSTVRVDAVNVTFDEVVINQTTTKDATYYSYLTPDKVGQPVQAHTEYFVPGATNTYPHKTDFTSDSCIRTAYEYSAANVDNGGSESYSNLFLSKITNYYTKADGTQGTEVTEYRHDRFGHVTKVTQGNLVTDNQYDGLSRLVKETRRDLGTGKNIVTNYLYPITSDSNGYNTQTISVKDELGNEEGNHVTTNYYNGLGQLVKTEKGTGNNIITVENIGYDEFGRKAYSFDGDNHKTSFTYDSLDRVKQISEYDKTYSQTSPGNYTVSIYDDAVTNVTGAVSSIEVKTLDLNAQKTGYNVLSRSIKYFDQNQNLVREDCYPNVNLTTVYTTTYTYNLANQITSIKDPKGMVLSYEYDFYGIKKLDYPGSLRKDDEYQYYAEDKTRQNKQIYDGNYIVTDIDELGRERQITYPDGRVVNKAYDFAGRLSSTEVNGYNATLGSFSNKIDYTYDLTGNIKTATHTFDSQTFTLTYAYDLAGNMTSITYPNGVKIDYAYDTFDRETKIPGFVEDTLIPTNPGITYYPDSSINSMVYNNGLNTTFEHDGLGRISWIKNNVMDYRYTYDGQDNVKTLSSYDAANNQIYNYSYEYNNLGWLTYATQTPNYYSFQYDAAGNRTVQNINGKVTNYGYSTTDLNCLTSINNNAVTYNGWGSMANGNLIYTYEYDNSNQLIVVKKKGRIVGKYYYNSEGKRYKKIDGDGTPLLPTYYIYNGDTLLYEQTGNIGTSYVYLNDHLVGKNERTDNAGVITSHNYFYSTDTLGSTRAVTDASGNLVGTVEYTPFGDEKPYFPESDKTSANQSNVESTNDIVMLTPGTKTLMNSGYKGNSVDINFGDTVGGDYTQTRLSTVGNMDTEKARYYYLWAMPELNAAWLDVAFREIDDPNTIYEYLPAEDGNRLVRVGEELVANQWNLVLVDARDGEIDGVDKNISSLCWNTNDNSQWRFDYMGVSKKDPMTFTGKQQDDTTGLYYFNARFYDPRLGRFLSEDPVKDGSNWYAYCDNNPLKYVDPSGMYTMKTDGAWLYGYHTPVKQKSPVNGQGFYRTGDWKGGPNGAVAIARISTANGNASLSCVGAEGSIGLHGGSLGAGIEVYMYKGEGRVKLLETTNYKVYVVGTLTGGSFGASAKIGMQGGVSVSLGAGAGIHYEIVRKDTNKAVIVVNGVGRSYGPSARKK